MADRKKTARRGMSTRRGFLVGIGGVTAAAVGFALWPRQWPNAMQGGPGETVVNSWIRISRDGRITIAVPQAEMGQGVYSGFLQIVADEMGADWRTMAVEPAPLHPAYANRFLAEEATSGMAPVLRDIARHVGVQIIERLDVQLTGGSTYIRGYEQTLREAGAMARALLSRAAAMQWEVDPDDPEIRTENGAVIYKANHMTFADAVAHADPKRLPRDIRLRDRSDRPLDGKAIQRIDIPSKLDGSARFGADVRLPGMVFAAIRHAPRGGRLVSATGAGVVKGPDWAAATGATSWEARRAVEALDLRFDAGPRPAGPWIADALTRSLAGEGGAVGGHGSLPPEGPESLVAEYRVPFLAHACMEPMTATARPSDAGMEIWSPTQSLTVTRHMVAEALGIDRARVTVYPTLLGGGFGRKAEGDAAVEAALIARAVGKPVQLLWSREEDIGADMYRPAAAARLRGDIDRSGIISAMEAKIAVASVQNSFARRVVPAVAPNSDKPDARSIEGADALPYDVEAFRAVHVPVEAGVPLGYWRSVGHSFTCFFIESFLDELAEKAGQDPLLLRRKLLAGRGRHLAVLDAAAEAAEWGTDADPGMARGLALHEGFGSVVAMIVEAGVIDGAIRIARVTSAIDCGGALNPNAVRAQVEGAALMGLSAALREEVTFENGVATVRNFDGYPLFSMAEMPEMTTAIVTGGAPRGGVGEPGTPPAAPALANALARATGKRARVLPLAGFYGG